MPSFTITKINTVILNPELTTDDKINAINEIILEQDGAVDLSDFPLPSTDRRNTLRALFTSLTPLHLAVLTGDQKLVAYLLNLKRNADLNFKSKTLALVYDPTDHMSNILTFLKQNSFCFYKQTASSQEGLTPLTLAFYCYAKTSFTTQNEQNRILAVFYHGKREGDPWKTVAGFDIGMVSSTGLKFANLYTNFASADCYLQTVKTLFASSLCVLTPEDIKLAQLLFDENDPMLELVLQHQPKKLLDADEKAEQKISVAEYKH